MEFKVTPDKDLYRWKNIPNQKNFMKFKETFKIKDMCPLGEYLSISAEYFLKLLQNGNVRGRSSIHHDDYDSRDFLYPYNFGYKIFDHSVLWRTTKGKIFCTSAPYQSSKEAVLNDFQKLKETFLYPESIKLQFLPEKYKFRPNGMFYFAIYDENVHEIFNEVLRKEMLINYKPDFYIGRQ